MFNLWCICWITVQALSRVQQMRQHIRSPLPMAQQLHRRLKLQIIYVPRRCLCSLLFSDPILDNISDRDPDTISLPSIHAHLSLHPPLLVNSTRTFTVTALLLPHLLVACNKHDHIRVHHLAAWDRWTAWVIEEWSHWERGVWEESGGDQGKEAFWREY